MQTALEPDPSNRTAPQSTKHTDDRITKLLSFFAGKVGTLSFVAAAITCLCLILGPAQAVAASESTAFFFGGDFTGGAKDLFFSYYENEQVNYIYARTNGVYASIRHTFQLERPLADPLFLHIKARNDDLVPHPSIQLLLNGVPLATGAGLFPEKAWQVQKFAIPKGLIRNGDNELVVSNLAPIGRVGETPWFMIAWCAVAPSDWTFGHDLSRDFYVDVPTEQRAFPEALPPGQNPGFKLRGVKGYDWTPEQYLAEIPILEKNRMNFLMNCYTGLFDRWQWGENDNHWWQPLPEAKRVGLEKVIQSAQEHGIKFCFSMNPQLFSPRPLDPANDADFEQLWQHYRWAQSRHVQWFNLALDDVEVMPGLRIDAEEHCRLANRLFARLRSNDPEAQLILCPTWYMGDGTAPSHQAYFATLARDLHPDIHLFWTGDGYTRITRKGAEGYKSKVRHRLIFWDNYPCNSGGPMLNLAPLTGRDPDICDVADGYMSNPMHQNQINRLPLMTCADYSYNPKAYDPERSIGQAILRLGETPEQRQLLKELVEASPGPLICKASDGSLNSLRQRFLALSAMPHSRFVVELYLQHIKDLSVRLQRLFPGQFEEARSTLDQNIAWMKTAFAARYRTE